MLSTYKYRKYNIIRTYMNKYYTFIDIHKQLCKFDVLYTSHFSYKFKILVSIYDYSHYYSVKDDINYINDVNNSIKSIFISLNKCTITFYFKQQIYIPYTYVNEYINLLQQYYITNPIIYSYIYFYYLTYNTTGQININTIKIIKKHISPLIYYNVIIFYFGSKYNYQIDEIIQNELFNMTCERIKLNSIYEIYFLRMANINNFVHYIISNNIILSKQLSNDVFSNYKYIIHNKIIDEQKKKRYFNTIH